MQYLPYVLFDIFARLNAELNQVFTTLVQIEISTNIRRITMKFGTDIHSAQRMTLVISFSCSATNSSSEVFQHLLDRLASLFIRPRFGPDHGPESTSMIRFYMTLADNIY